jgi:hypothetical protein
VGLGGAKKGLGGARTRIDPGKKVSPKCDFGLTLSFYFRTFHLKMAQDQSTQGKNKNHISNMTRQKLLTYSFLINEVVSGHNRDPTRCPLLCYIRLL